MSRHLTVEFDDSCGVLESWRAEADSAQVEHGGYLTG